MTKLNILKKYSSVLILISRLCFSGILGILILNFIIGFYSLQSMHIDNPVHTTDYTWVSNSKWIKMTEGISWGRLDSNGFNNLQLVKNPEVLILGSSHMEAINVMQNENTASLLQLEFENKDLPFSVYNRGISGHHFLKCCKYLMNNTQSDALKYVIIETSRVDFSKNAIEDLFDGNIDFTPSYTKGIISFIQKFPLFRLLYFQFKDMHIDLLNFVDKKNKIPVAKDVFSVYDRVSYNKLFSFIIENSNSKHIIIFYHPTGIPDENGNLVYETDRNALSLFRETAEEYGIDFIDLTAQTDELWYTEHKTTHGFCTGTAFGGHLNKNGHKLAASAIADVILANEANTKGEN